MTRFSMTPRKTLIPTTQTRTLAWKKIAYLLERLHGKEFGFLGIYSTIENVVDGFTERSEDRKEVKTEWSAHIPAQ